MKTKLELYQAVQACVEQTLDAKPPEANKVFDALIKPLGLAPADVDGSSQLVYSRRRWLLHLREEPLTETAAPKPAAKPAK